MSNILSKLVIDGKEIDIPTSSQTTPSIVSGDAIAYDYSVNIIGEVSKNEYVNLVPNGTGPLISTPNFNSFVFKLPIGIRIKDKLGSNTTCCFFDEQPTIGSQYDTIIGKPSLKDWVEVKLPYCMIMASSRTTEFTLEITNNLRSDVYMLNFLKDKNIVCFGDSNTDNNNANGENKCYPEYIEEMTGANVFNFGFTGTRLSERTVNQSSSSATEQNIYAACDLVMIANAIKTNDWTDIDAKLNAGSSYNNAAKFKEKVAKIKATDWSTIDIVTIYHMSNDWQGSNAVGSIDSSNINEVYGAFNIIMDALYSKNPFIKIYFILPFNVWVTDTNTGAAVWSTEKKNNQGLTLEDYREKIKTISAEYGVPVLDLSKVLGLNKLNVTSWCQNKMEQHARAGYDKMAEKIIKFLNAN